MIAPTSLSKFRAIACFTVVRKLVGYFWLQTLPALHFETFQTGFVKGMQAADGVFVVNRVAELSREWGCEIHVVQLDIRRAFDRVLHSAVIKALKLQGASLQCIALICAILLDSQMSMKLGTLVAGKIRLNRGLPQGAPESPLIFILVVEYVLRKVKAMWRN